MATGDSSSIRRAGNILPFTLDAAVASSVASRDLFLAPPGYRLVSVKSSFGVASTSGTYAIRKITDASAPNAAAGATVVELLSGTTAALSGTANTALTPALTTVSGALVFKAGDRIAVNFAGTMTNLVGGLLQLEFVSSNRYGVS